MFPQCCRFFSCFHSNSTAFQIPSMFHIAFHGISTVSPKLRECFHLVSTAFLHVYSMSSVLPRSLHPSIVSPGLHQETQEEQRPLSNLNESLWGICFFLRNKSFFVSKNLWTRTRSQFICSKARFCACAWLGWCRPMYRLEPNGVLLEPNGSKLVLFLGFKTSNPLLLAGWVKATKHTCESSQRLQSARAYSGDAGILESQKSWPNKKQRKTAAAASCCFCGFFGVCGCSEFPWLAEAVGWRNCWAIRNESLKRS